MLPFPELLAVLEKIQTIPVNGPFSRFVPFDVMVSRETGRMATASGPGVGLGQYLWRRLQHGTAKIMPPEHQSTVDVSATTKVVPGKPRPLWGIGSIKNGGRYNQPRTFEVVYLAEDPITALTEVGRIFAPSPALVKVKGPPVVYITVDGILDRTLDLSSTEVQSKLATSHQELTGAWLFEQGKTGEAPTQRLGRAAFESKRLCALRYPSAKNAGGICVAVLPERLSGPAYLEVFDPFGNLAQRLPTPA